MASHTMKLNEGKISSSNRGNEVSRSNSNRRWWHKKHKNNIIDDSNHEIVAKTTELFVNLDLPSPFVHTNLHLTYFKINFYLLFSINTLRLRLLSNHFQCLRI